jgi:hypothetical protein
MASSLEEHTRQLASMLEGPPPEVLDRLRRFVTAFVRPHGPDVPATGIAGDALERLATKHAAASVPRPTIVGRLGWRLVRAVAEHPRWRLLLLNEGEVEAAGRHGEKAKTSQAALERKRVQREAKARRAAERERALVQKRLQQDEERRRA